ncbi:hypothetical protein L484_011095 [Morus notabilis]|uniref:Uncharacterized protein n=1 Tax=Morus notabilis TaxID=981085 RepID=W9QF84_9ROSA|nr:hypothetical protein L484_011095 [Morus notabilis]
MGQSFYILYVCINLFSYSKFSSRLIIGFLNAIVDGICYGACRKRHGHPVVTSASKRWSVRCTKGSGSRIEAGETAALMENGGRTFYFLNSCLPKAIKG